MKKTFILFLSLLFLSTGVYAQKKYSVGDRYAEGGVKGVVFYFTDGGYHGKILSLEESEQLWCSSLIYKIVTPRNTDNGYLNTKYLSEGENLNDYPAFEWCRSLGAGWYIPSLNEVLEIYKNKEIVNKTLYYYGGKTISNQKMWTSTECDEVRAYHVYMDSGKIYPSEKIEDGRYVRAVRSF